MTFAIGDSDYRGPLFVRSDAAIGTIVVKAAPPEPRRPSFFRPLAYFAPLQLAFVAAFRRFPNPQPLFQANCGLIKYASRRMLYVAFINPILAAVRTLPSVRTWMLPWRVRRSPKTCSTRARALNNRWLVACSSRFNLRRLLPF